MFLPGGLAAALLLFHLAHELGGVFDVGDHVHHFARLLELLEEAVDFFYVGAGAFCYAGATCAFDYFGMGALVGCH